EVEDAVQLLRPGERLRFLAPGPVADVRDPLRIGQPLLSVLALRDVLGGATRGGRPVALAGDELPTPVDPADRTVREHDAVLVAVGPPVEAAPLDDALELVAVVRMHGGQEPVVGGRPG